MLSPSHYRLNTWLFRLGWEPAQENNYFQFKNVEMGELLQYLSKEFIAIHKYNENKSIVTISYKRAKFFSYTSSELYSHGILCDLHVHKSSPFLPYYKFKENVPSIPKDCYFGEYNPTMMLRETLKSLPLQVKR